MLGNTLLITGGTAAVGLYYGWVLDQKEKLLLRNPARQATNEEKEYLSCVLSSESVTSLLHIMQETLSRDYCYDYRQPIRTMDMNADIRKTWLDVINVLNNTRQLINKFQSKPRNRKQFFTELFQIYSMPLAGNDVPQSIPVSELMKKLLDLKMGVTVATMKSQDTDLTFKDAWEGYTVAVNNAQGNDSTDCHAAQVIRKTLEPSA
jgi:hypothetical protein